MVAWCFMTTLRQLTSHEMRLTKFWICLMQISCTAMLRSWNWSPGCLCRSRQGTAFKGIFIPVVRQWRFLAAEHLRPTHLPLTKSPFHLWSEGVLSTIWSVQQTLPQINPTKMLTLDRRNRIRATSEEHHRFRRTIFQLFHPRRRRKVPRMRRIREW